MAEYSTKDTEENPNIDIADFVGEQNIASKIDRRELEELSIQVVSDFEIDDTNFATKRDRISDLYALALQTLEQKDYPFPKASNIKYPILTKAAISFASMAFPAIVQDDKLVKGKVIGKDEGGDYVLDSNKQPMLDQHTGEKIRKGKGEKQKKADRVAAFMSNQIIEEMDNWEDDMDKLLHILPIIGCAFKKTYYDYSKRKNISSLVLPQYLICNDDGSRKSELINLLPHEIEENIRLGIFEQFDYNTSNETKEDTYHDQDREEKSIHVDADSPHVFIEQHRRIDLDGDGYTEPYVVWVHKESNTVVRVLARYEAEDIELDAKGGVLKVSEQHMYTKYGFIPDPEGSYYDIGLGHLLQHLNISINTTVNQMIDQGHRYTMGGGFIAEGTKLKGGDLKFRPGEYKRVRASGMSLRESVVNLDMPEPSTVLFALMEALVNAAEDIAMLAKAMSGDIPANVPATTMLTIIEQSLTPFKAVFKRIHRSLKHELKRLAYLNKMYLDVAEYRDVLDDPEATLDDFNAGDIAPISDPDIVNNVQKMVRAQILMDMKDDPFVNPVEIRKRALQGMGIKDVDRLVRAPEPQGLDEVQQAQIALFNKQIEEIGQNMQIKAIEAQIKIDESIEEVKNIRADTIKKLAEAESEEAGTQLNQLNSYVENMQKLRERLVNAGDQSGNAGALEVPPRNPNNP